MSQTLPLVTVIIPYFNHGKYLQATVQSALASYCGPLEIIIVNDGSKEKLAASYLNSARLLSDKVSVIEKQNGGLSSARNTGILASKGEYIQLLDSDDMLFVDKITRQVRSLLVAPDIGVSLCGYAFTDPWMVKFDSAYDSISRFPLTNESFLFLWERGFSIPIHTALFRRDIFERVQFNTLVEGKEDWIFWCELKWLEQRRLSYLPFLGVSYRGHDDSMTRSMSRMGRSFVIATKEINKKWGNIYDNFLVESKKWYEEFYVPRALEEEWQMDDQPKLLSVQCLPSGQNLNKLMLYSASTTKLANEKKISLIIPVYNHFEYLDECINSAIVQSGLSEIIIINDCSTDVRVAGCLSVWAERDSRIMIIHNEKNLGIAASQNLAVQSASSEYIAFLDCDDSLEPNASIVMLAAIAECNADYLFTDRYDVDAMGTTVRTAKYGGYDWITPSEDLISDLFLGMVASHWKVIRREIYLSVGGSDEALTGVQDWDLALKIARQGTFYYVQQPLYCHRVHQNSVTSSDTIAQIWKSNVVRRKHLQMIEHEFAQTCETLQAIYYTGLIDREKIKSLLMAKISGRSVVLDRLSNPLELREIDLLRDFNSVFDELYLIDIDQVSLLGYLWSHKSLNPCSYWEF